MDPNLVKFQFSLGQKVKTVLGSVGIVRMQGKDEAGVQYYVNTEHNSAWFKESQLESVE